MGIKMAENCESRVGKESTVSIPFAQSLVGLQDALTALHNKLLLMCRLDAALPFKSTHGFEAYRTGILARNNELKFPRGSVKGNCTIEPHRAKLKKHRRPTEITSHEQINERYSFVGNTRLTPEEEKAIFDPSTNAKSIGAAFSIPVFEIWRGESRALRCARVDNSFEVESSGLDFVATMDVDTVPIEDYPDGLGIGYGAYNVTRSAQSKIGMSLEAELLNAVVRHEIALEYWHDCRVVDVTKDGELVVRDIRGNRTVPREFVQAELANCTADILGCCDLLDAAKRKMGIDFNEQAIARALARQQASPDLKLVVG